MLLFFVACLPWTAQVTRSAIDASERVPLVDGFSTPTWPEVGATLMRMERSGSSAILVTMISYKDSDELPIQRPPVFRYDPDSGALSQVPIDQWENSTTSICKRVGGDRGFGGFVIDSARDPNTKATLPLAGSRLYFRSQTVSTLGRIALALVPVGDERVAVLSATRYHPPDMFLGLPEDIGGPYMQQMFSLRTGEPAGAVVTLELPECSGRVTATLSPDGKFLAYFSGKHTHVCFVSVDATQTRPRRAASRAGAPSFQSGSSGLPFVTPNWPEVGVPLIRLERDGGAAILLGVEEPPGDADARPRRNPTVYRYDPKNDCLSSVADAAWTNATTVIRKLALENRYENFEIRLAGEPRGHVLPGLFASRLCFGDEELSTSGRIVLGLIPVDDERVASLSAITYYPAESTSGQPEYVNGPYEQRLFFTKTGGSASPVLPLKLPDCSGRAKGALVPGGNFLVYFSEKNTHVCFVPVEPVRKSVSSAVASQPLEKSP